MIRIVIEIDERRQDDAFRDRLQRAVDRDRRILRRDDEPERIYCADGLLRWPYGARLA